MVLPLLSQKSKIWRAAVLLPMIPMQMVYCHWRFTSTVEPFALEVAVLWQYLFLITELFVIVYSVWQCATLVRYTDRSSMCDKLIKKQGLLPERSVDLFIPTYDESVRILRTTILAAKNADYKNLTIWICDDSNRTWLRALCLSHGVNYLCRPTTEPVRSKAANLSWSIPHGVGEFVVCLDADFRLEPQMISRLTSFLHLPSTGLVQAPQHFRNLDPIQRNLLGNSAWTEEQRFFFDIGLPSRDGWDNALCVGSCWASKRSLIKELDGFPVSSIVEDVYFGYLIKARGYKTVYLNERLATGLAAEDTPSYVVQRTRWCLGAMALLSDPHGPFRCRGLRLIDRLFYFEISFYWVTHLHLLLLLFAPAMFGLFGYNVFNCTTEELLTILMPKNIVLCAVFYWVSSGRCMPIITPVQKTLTVFQVVPAIFKGLLTPHRAKFNVTRKDIKHTGRTIHWGLAAPFIVVGVLTIIAVTKTCFQNYSEFYWSDYSAFNALLSAYSLVALFLCCLVCVDKPSAVTNENEEMPLVGNLLRASLMLSKRVFS